MKALPPWRHHFLPQFYLKQWCGGDGLLQVFDRPYNAVKTRRLAPAGIGYEPHLYAWPGTDPSDQQVIEQHFFQEVDTKGAEAHEKLLSMSKAGWNGAERSAWSRTIMGLWVRPPEELAAFKRAAQAHWDATLVPEAEYQRLRKDVDPPTWLEWEAKNAPHAVEHVALRAFMEMVDDEKVGAFINSLHWQVINLGPSSKTLMSSDRPVMRSEVLDSPTGYIALPISPRLLFVAARRREFFDSLQRHHPTKIALVVNEAVVKQAVRFVIATTNSGFAYVDRNMGVAPGKYSGSSMEAAAKRLIGLGVLKP